METERFFKIGVACGGTGGHILPGLATAAELTARGHEATLWLTGSDVERAATKRWTGPVVNVASAGFMTGFHPKSIKTSLKLYNAYRQCRSIMRAKMPDAMLGMGSYACVGPLAAGVRLKVPIVLHEANVLPGKAITMFARKAARVAGTFEETRYYLKNHEIVLTGMPLRQRMTNSEIHEETSSLMDRGALTVLVIGGSRGAYRINEVLPSALAALKAKGQDVQVIHLAGREDETAVCEAYKSAGIKALVHGFVNEMSPFYHAADFAVCRSGASTCAELSAFGVPALLVPYPFATRNHQMANARAMEKQGAADVVSEEDLTSDWLSDYILGCLENPGRLAKMSAATKHRSQLDAAKRLADLVEEAAHSKSKD